MLKIDFVYKGKCDKLLGPFVPDKKEMDGKIKIVEEFLKAHYSTLEFDILGVSACLDKDYFKVQTACTNRTGHSTLIGYSLNEFFKRDHLDRYGFYDIVPYYEDDHTDLLCFIDWELFDSDLMI